MTLPLEIVVCDHAAAVDRRAAYDQEKTAAQSCGG
jgi:hypothetical protein